MRALIAIVCFLCVWMTASPARAEDDGDDRAFAAFAAGATAAVVPLLIGGIRAANGNGFAQKDAGLMVGTVGVALAPITAHLAIREYGRAAAFGAIPVASAIGAAALLSAKPDAVFSGNVGSRATFALLFSACVFGSGLGIVDAMSWRDRRSDPPRVAFGVAPGSVSLRGVF